VAGLMMWPVSDRARWWHGQRPARANYLCILLTIISRHNRFYPVSFSSPDIDVRAIANYRCPITPAATSPVLIPTRRPIGSPVQDLWVLVPALDEPQAIRAEQENKDQ
jgi:hypothetical protein